MMIKAVSALFLFGLAAASSFCPPAGICPLPQWTPTYNLSMSTICQPGSTEDFLNATEAAQWGLVSLDWSIARSVWSPKGTPPNKTTGAATLVEQCRLIKAVNNATKCFVYRNTELALEWFEPQRAVMYDPAYAGFFLQYQPGNPGNVTPGTIYNEDGGCGGCNQFFWNYSNPLTVEFVLQHSEMGPYGVDSPYVDGTFLDDMSGLPAEHQKAPANMGLTAQDVLVLQNATTAVANLIVDTLAARGKFNWQAFHQQSLSASSCGNDLPGLISPSWQSVPWFLPWNASCANSTLAAFLIGRGPIAYVGHGWNGQPLPPYDPAFSYDFGVPLGLGARVSENVYTRAWTKGNVTLDCSTWTATLPI